MAAQGLNGKPWGQKGQNRDEHASLLMAEAQQLLTIMAPQDTVKNDRGQQVPKKAKSITPTVARAFLSSVVEFLQDRNQTRV
jgi:hypothetical protein